MNKKKIKAIQKKIRLYYESEKRNLPWRSKLGKKQDPYKTLISEVMLQQTRVITVIKYYKNFLKEYPNIKSLALANEEKILKVWAGMGYYRRAINLLKTAKIIYNKYKGKIPSDKKTLMTLPGIGEYTASAISNFAFGKDEVVIDTNVERFITRTFNILNHNSDSTKIKVYANKIFPCEGKGNFAQAIMDFANHYCVKLNPKCTECIISKYCNYKENDKIKITKIKKKIKYCTSYFIFNDKKKFFVRRRPLNKILGGMYEIPTSLWTESKISKDKFLKLKNDKNIIISKDFIRHEFSHIILFTKIIILNINCIFNSKLRGKWVDQKDFQKLPISKLTEKVVTYSFDKLCDLKKFL